MGFFSDLKEDLSQAVNELIPEEEMQEEMTEELAAEETFEMPEENVQEEETVMEENNMADTLESLLEQIDIQETVVPVVEKPQMSSMSYASKSSISDEVAVVTAGMKIKGDVTSDGSMDVIGTIEGNIDIIIHKIYLYLITRKNILINSRFHSLYA